MSRVLTNEYILNELTDIPDIQIEEQDEKSILVWDDGDDKEIRFRFLEKWKRKCNYYKR